MPEGTTDNSTPEGADTPRPAGPAAGRSGGQAAADAPVYPAFEARSRSEVGGEAPAIVGPVPRKRSSRREWRVPPGVVPPPPRPGDRHVRVHRLGVVLASDRLRRRVDQRFHLPMIVLSILVLPLLAVELLVFPRYPVFQNGILGLLVPIGLGVIWLAFFVEFVIKIAIAECRIEYVRRHWLDVVIIALPVLRPLRVARIARTARIFTLRGVGMKFLRYGLAVIIGAEVGERLAERFGLKKNPRPDPGKMTRHQLETELRLQRRRVDAWDAWFVEHRTHRERYGTDEAFDSRLTPEVTVQADDDAADGPVAGETDEGPDAAGDPTRDGAGDAAGREPGVSGLDAGHGAAPVPRR